MNPKQFIAGMATMLRNLWSFYVIALVIGVIFIIIGARSEIVSPMPGPDNNTLNPLLDIMKDDYSASLSRVIGTTGNTLLIAAALLATVLIQFGIITLAAFYYYCVIVGGEIGWFAKFPGTSVLNGLIAYGSSDLFYFLAFTLILSFSFWVSFVALKPEPEMSRWLSMKQRFFRVVYIAPVVAILIMIGIVTQFSISIPLQKHYAQKAIKSQNRKEITADDESWTVQAPDSWERTYYERADDNKGAFLLNDEILGVIVEIRIVEMEGQYSSEEIKRYLSPFTIEGLEQRGLEYLEGPLETTLGSYESFKYKFHGYDSTLGKDNNTEDLFVIPTSGPQSDFITVATILVRYNTNSYEFTEPLVLDTLNTFRVT